MIAVGNVSALLAPSFYPVHVDLKQNKHAEYWLMGGRGSCKSSFVSLEILLGLLRDKESNAIIYRKVADTIRDSVYAQMLWAIEALGMTHLWHCRVSPMELTYVFTGQRVLFRGADDPQKSKGIKLQKGYFRFLWFEELAEFDGMDAIRTIKASVVRSGSTITFYTYNPPQTASNWVNREALRTVPGRLTHHSTYLNVPKEWLGESFLADAEAIRQTDERTYRHMYLGEATGTGGQVFDNLTLRQITDEEITRMGSFYDGLDFGYWPDPSHWVRVSYDASSRILCVLDELRVYRTGDRELAAMLKAEKGLTRQTEIIADSASEKPLSDLRSEGLTVSGALKGAGSVAAGIKWLRTRAAIIIDPQRTPDTAREFREYEHERNRAGEYTATYPDRGNHAIDAVRYATNRIWLRKDR